MDELSKTPLFQSDLGLNDLKELIAEWFVLIFIHTPSNHKKDLLSKTKKIYL